MASLVPGCSASFISSTGKRGKGLDGKDAIPSFTKKAIPEEEKINCPQRPLLLPFGAPDTGYYGLEKLNFFSLLDRTS